MTAHSLLQQVRLLLIVSLGSAMPSVAAAATEDALLAKIFFKSATYDEALPESELRVLVTGKQPQRVQAVTDVLRRFSRMTVNGRALTVQAYTYSSVAALEAKVNEQPLYGLFVTGTPSASDVARIVEMATRRKVYTFTDAPELVRAGIVASAHQKDGRLQVLLNLPAAVATGRRFKGAFLQLCEVVR